MLIHPAALKAIADKTAVSKSELAMAAGCSLGHICDLFVGRRNAKAATIAALAKRLDVSTEAIVVPQKLIDEAVSRAVNSRRGRRAFVASEVAK